MQSRSVLFTCFFLLAPGHIRAQAIAGRIADAANGAAVAGARITAVPLENAAVGASATDSDADGQFLLRPPAGGRMVVTIALIGYETRVDTVDVPAAGLVRAFELTPTAVRVDSVAVEARARSHVNVTPLASRAHLVSGSDLLELEEMGVSMEQAVRRLPGLRFRPVRFPRRGVRTCVEHIRRISGFETAKNQPPCQSVLLVIDDVIITEPEDVSDELKTLNLAEVESIQVIPPHDAQIRFGLDGGARGVIQVYRRGWGPYVSPDRNPKRQ